MRGGSGSGLEGDTGEQLVLSELDEFPLSVSFNESMANAGAWECLQQKIRRRGKLTIYQCMGRYRGQCYHSTGSHENLNR